MFFEPTYTFCGAGKGFLVPNPAPGTQHRTGTAPVSDRSAQQVIAGPRRLATVAPTVDPFRALRPDMAFSEAADVFLASKAPLNQGGRVQFMGPRTYRDLGNVLGTLKKFFGETRLDVIHPGHFTAYQKARANGDGFFRWVGAGAERRQVPSQAGAPKINEEMAAMRRVLVAAGAWTGQMEQLYKPLQEPDNELQRALSEDEQERFLAFAASIPEAKVVWWYSLVALHTCFSSDEMRTIRQGDINLEQGILGVNRRYGKNRFRRREVQLTDDKCIWALERLLERSVQLGGRGPQLHLFPKRVVRDHYDGSRPMSETGLRKPFEYVRACAGLQWFRLNGFRHTAITRLAEAGVPIAVIQRRAGHTSPKMTDHYTHISEQVERKEMMRVSSRARAGARTTAEVLQMEKGSAILHSEANWCGYSRERQR